MNPVKLNPTVKNIDIKANPHIRRIKLPMTLISPEKIPLVIVMTKKNNIIIVPIE